MYVQVKPTIRLLVVSEELGAFEISNSQRS
jgi:hypothetical protein